MHQNLHLFYLNKAIKFSYIQSLNYKFYSNCKNCVKKPFLEQVGVKFKMTGMKYYLLIFQPQFFKPS